MGLGGEEGGGVRELGKRGRRGRFCFAGFCGERVSGFLVFFFLSCWWVRL